MLMTVVAILGLILSFITSWFQWRAGRAAHDEVPFSVSFSVRRYLMVRRVVQASRFEHIKQLDFDVVREYSRRPLGGYRLRLRMATLALSTSLRGRPRTDLPGWAFVLLGPDDAERYRKEWGAHLWELIEADELKQARRDRRRLICVIFWLALVIRVHRVLTRARAH